MKKNERELCMYCGKWYSLETMTPLFERGKTSIKYYCERCYLDVKENIRSLPWYDSYSWGEKGQRRD